MIVYNTKSVCSKKIEFEINDNKIYDVKFYGGCNGNLNAISKLIEGMEVSKVITLLEGNRCGLRETSCADQLVVAIKEVLNK